MTNRRRVELSFTIFLKMAAAGGLGATAGFRLAVVFAAARSSARLFGAAAAAAAVAGIIFCRGAAVDLGATVDILLVVLLEV